VYAIIEDSGTQIKVSPGDVVDIDLRSDVDKQPSKLTFDRVLLVGDGEKAAKIGTPYIDGATVTAEVIEQFKGEKLDVLMYKRRKGQRRKMGHRQNHLKIKIGDIKM
jgi:large subunit ribosomal protein L21